MLGGLRIALLSAKPVLKWTSWFELRAKPTPVQVIWRPDGQLEIESGQPTTFPLVEPRRLSSIVNGSQQWTAIEQSHVREAVALLSPDGTGCLETDPTAQRAKQEAENGLKADSTSKKGVSLGFVCTPLHLQVDTSSFPARPAALNQRRLPPFSTKLPTPSIMRLQGQHFVRWSKETKPSNAESINTTEQ